jgi:4'-phosphopantetheinyl transferase
MPLIINENITDDFILGVWEIDENEEDLYRTVKLTRAEDDHFQTIKNHQKRKQWLAYHATIAHLIGTDKAEIVYDAYGKPHLKNKSHYISVSHSGNYSTVILSKTFPVGIDIENIRDRIERVKDMFLSKEEVSRIGTEDRIEKLIICWSAKEAIFKIYGNPALLCMQDISIEPFDYLCSGKGSTIATVKITKKTERYTIFYRKIVDYMMVYAYDVLKTKSTSSLSPSGEGARG